MRDGGGNYLQLRPAFEPEKVSNTKKSLEYPIGMICELVIILIDWLKGNSERVLFVLIGREDERVVSSDGIVPLHQGGLCW